MAHLTPLSLFLDQAMRTPFAWGGHDCLLYPSDWVKLCTGKDPAARYRGAYKSQAGAVRILMREAGLLRLADREMTACGFAEAEAVRAGDVGVVLAPTDRGLAEVGAVFNGFIWTALSARGMAAAPFQAVKVWRLG